MNIKLLSATFTRLYVYINMYIFKCYESCWSWMRKHTVCFRLNFAFGFRVSFRNNIFLFLFFFRWKKIDRCLNCMMLFVFFCFSPHEVDRECAYGYICALSVLIWVYSILYMAICVCFISRKPNFLRISEQLYTNTFCGAKKIFYIHS